MITLVYFAHIIISWTPAPSTNLQSLYLGKFNAISCTDFAIDPLPPLRHNVGGWSKVRFNWNRDFAPAQEKRIQLDLATLYSCRIQYIDARVSVQSLKIKATADSSTSAPDSKEPPAPQADNPLG